MRRKKISIWELSVDPIPNSPNQNHKNCLESARRITNVIFGLKGLNDVWFSF